MGAIFSKRPRKIDKQILKEEFDVGERTDGHNDQNHIITTHNNSVIHDSNKDIPLFVPNSNGVRYEDILLHEGKSKEMKEISMLKKELEEFKNLLEENSKENRLLSAELSQLKNNYQHSGKITDGVEDKLKEKLLEERDQVHEYISQQIDNKLKEQEISVNKLIETSKSSVLQDVAQQQTAQAYDEVESLKELIRILSVSTVIKNTAHLNYSPTEAMDTIEIKISFSSGTEKKTPRMINVQNLMRITTIHELKYHLAEKYKHLKVGELVIKWKGIELADGATLLEYGICNKDRMDLEVRAVVTYKIQIQLDKESKLPIEVTPATKIRFIKDWIHDQTRITVEKQLLRHGEHLLHDDKRVAECQILEGDIIRLEICHVGSFPIFVVNPSGIKIQVDVESRDTIETVKLQVSNKMHIHISQFELFVKNVPAESSKQVYEYNVVSGETFHLRMITPPNTTTFPTNNFY